MPNLGGLITRPLSMFGQYKIMKNISIPIITKEEFRKKFIDAIVHDKESYLRTDFFEYLVDDGFVKLDFENLDKTLAAHLLYFQTVAVDFGDNQYYWLVSGSKAILINKEV